MSPWPSCWWTPPSPAPTPEDGRLTKLEAAYRQGRITEEAYRANLARLGLTPPPPPIESPQTADNRRTMLDNAFLEGRISRETYEANLAKLAPAGPAPMQDKMAALRAAFREGKIGRRLFAANLACALGLTGDERAGNLVQAFIAGRIEADLLEKNLRRLRRE